MTPVIIRRRIALVFYTVAIIAAVWPVTFTFLGTTIPCGTPVVAINQPYPAGGDQATSDLTNECHAKGFEQSGLGVGMAIAAVFMYPYKTRGRITRVQGDHPAGGYCYRCQKPWPCREALWAGAVIATSPPVPDVPL